MAKKALSPRASFPATLNDSLIERVIAAFPAGVGWTKFWCRDLISPKAEENSRVSLSWNATETPDSSAGVYAFLFPKRVFPKRCALVLHGPSVKGRPRRIVFEVRARGLQSVGDGLFVAYVGRSANLSNRMRLHFHATKKTTAAQVRKALEGCLSLSTRAARDFMLQHAVVAYCPIPGDENVANRDIIEVALWAKYRTPFNIKSER